MAETAAKTAKLTTSATGPGPRTRARRAPRTIAARAGDPETQRRSRPPPAQLRLLGPPHRKALRTPGRTAPKPHLGRRNGRTLWSLRRLRPAARHRERPPRRTPGRQGRSKPTPPPDSSGLELGRGILFGRDSGRGRSGALQSKGLAATAAEAGRRPVPVSALRTGKSSWGLARRAGGAGDGLGPGVLGRRSPFGRRRGRLRTAKDGPRAARRYARAAAGRNDGRTAPLAYSLRRSPDRRVRQVPPRGGPRFRPSRSAPAPAPARSHDKTRLWRVQCPADRTGSLVGHLVRAHGLEALEFPKYGIDVPDRNVEADGRQWGLTASLVRIVL